MKCLDHHQSFTCWVWPDASRAHACVFTALERQGMREEIKLSFRGTERLEIFPPGDGNYWVAIEFCRQKICKWRFLPFYTWLLSRLYFTSILTWVQSSSHDEHDIQVTHCRNCFIWYKVDLILFYRLVKRGMLSHYGVIVACLLIQSYKRKTFHETTNISLNINIKLLFSPIDIWSVNSIKLQHTKRVTTWPEFTKAPCPEKRFIPYYCILHYSLFYISFLYLKSYKFLFC